MRMKVVRIPLESKIVEMIGYLAKIWTNNKCRRIIQKNATPNTGSKGSKDWLFSIWIWDNWAGSMWKHLHQPTTLCFHVPDKMWHGSQRVGSCPNIESNMFIWTCPFNLQNGNRGGQSHHSQKIGVRPWLETKKPWSSMRMPWGRKPESPDIEWNRDQATKR